ncbi:hypothetical protein D043_2941B, partial [Vibrio parahaemolyticus EKP-021]
DELNVR